MLPILLLLLILYVNTRFYRIRRELRKEILAKLEEVYKKANSNMLSANMENISTIRDISERYDYDIGKSLVRNIKIIREICPHHRIRFEHNEKVCDICGRVLIQYPNDADYFSEKNEYDKSVERDNLEKQKAELEAKLERLSKVSGTMKPKRDKRGRYSK